MMSSAQRSAHQPEALMQADVVLRRRPGKWRARFTSLAGNRPALVAAIVIVALVICAVFAPVVAPHDPQAQTLSLRLKPPAWLDGGSWSHPLGTDALGRDLLSRVIFGARISLVVGITAVVIQGLIGVTLGMVAGYRGGRVDSLIMALTDIQYALPFLVVAIAIMAIIGASFRNVILVLGVTGWVYYARLVRAEVLGLRRRDFVEAAVASGAGPGRVMMHHILPNVMTQVTVVASLQVAAMIISEASLSFLGLGIPPEVPSWGAMVAEGRTYVSNGWWTPTFPGLAILITAMSVNILGDWLREELDPAMRTS